MVFPGPSRVIGHGVIRLLSALHIIKDREKCASSFNTYLCEYKDAFRMIVRYPLVLLVVLLTNILQRIAICLVPFFVCLSIDGNASFTPILASQAFVSLGANSIPIPGAVGVSEYLCLSLTAPLLTSGFKKQFTLLSRLISHYFCFVLCGVYTLGYHCTHVIKNYKKKEK